MSSWIKRITKDLLLHLERMFLWVSNPPENSWRKIKLFQTPLVLILTFIPIMNIAYIIATVGENNLSNDVVFWVDLVEKSLNGEATLSLFLDSSFLYPHFFALHIALELLNAHLFGWNIYVTLFFGYFLNLIKLALLFDLFTFRNSKNPLKWWLLPFLSAAVFSNMEVTTFTGQNTSTLIGMSVFGAILGIWGIARFPNQLRGVGFSFLGCLLSTWTFALGLITWPIVLGSMILSGTRQVRQYLTFFAGAAIALFPYLYFIVLKPENSPTIVKTSPKSLLDINFILNLLGRPLVDLWSLDFTLRYKLVGAIGAAFAVGCLIVFIVHFFRRSYMVFLPPLLITVLGFCASWMISLGRASLDAWYISVAWPFWQGIIGFAFILLLQPSTLPGTLIGSIFEQIKKIGAVVFFLTIALLYAKSNIGNEVYATLAYSRTPVSSSCLRNYATAPTYCEGYLFQWPIQRPEYIFELGYPLANKQLSASSLHQYWSLQGDFIFDRVQEKRFANTAPIAWYEDLNGDRIDWYGLKRWHRSDLLVYSPNSVQWSVEFPDHMTSAVLNSAVGVRHSNPIDPEADGVTFQVSIEEDGRAKKISFEKFVPPGENQWVPFRIDLSSFRGKKVTLQFTSLPGKNNVADWAMYQHPVIDIRMNKHDANDKNIKYTPENTDTFPGFQMPHEKDVVWDGNNMDLWNLNNMTAIEDRPGFYMGGEDPFFQLKSPVNLCLADYTHLYVKFAAPKGTKRVSQIFVQLSSEPGFTERYSATFTILGDGKVHMYTFPIRLLDMDIGYNERLVNIRFDPINEFNDSGNTIQFEELGLLRGDEPSICK